MIRIEGIPIVAARLAAMQKAAKAIEPSRPVRPHRRQKKPGSHGLSIRTDSPVTGECPSV
jgi:hypothetical protein